MTKKYAIISVSDKDGLIKFVHELIALNFEIISTGGTFKTLKDNGINTIPIEKITDFPEILDGRVKTLNPKIYGGILALRDNKEHLDVCNEHNLILIDLVVVNLYPFEKVTKNPEVNFSEAIENIDIGGPTLIRAAAKNYSFVGVVTNPSQYQEVISELKETKGELSLKIKEQLALAAFKYTSTYDTIIHNFLNQKFSPVKSEFPTLLTPVFEKITDLRYGENPHQKAAFYQEKEAGVGLSQIEQLHGKELSFNNLMDLEAAWSIAKEFELPAAVIIKHTNPCGAAIGDDILDAYKKAYESDPVSAFGSIIGLNRIVTKEAALEIDKIFVEAVIAPDYEKEAITILSQKIGIRIIKMPNFFKENPNLQYKFIKGAALVQTANNKNIKNEDFKVVTKKRPTKKEINDLIFAQTIAKHVKSNAIVIAKNGQTLGIGAGQMSRIDAVNIALEKAGSKSIGAVAGSDAFFPFKDSIEAFAAKGIAAVVQPGGSKRDQESIDAADDLAITMVFCDFRFFYH
ncbi:MAG: bifunctional phosphoribosylaminoimidazolecarboxamide formyltransferase/IMP cyclohydrolase [Candidatus Margulisiibacteriota bacterium]|jgi:phosphoribosylaminoimidazolecarboxamide formyltransferase/IMP cyclohydrolase